MNISDEDVEKAWDYLRDSAAEIGAAKYRLVKAEHMVRHIKALEMKKWAGHPVNAQEREALSSTNYKHALEEEAAAAGDYEKLKSLREAADLKIACWQTMSANARGRI